MKSCHLGAQAPPAIVTSFSCIDAKAAAPPGTCTDAGEAADTGPIKIAGTR